MKPLIMILLLASVAQAQTIADAARKERQRQSQVQSVLVITNDVARRFIPAQEAARAEGQPPAEGQPAAAPAITAEAEKTTTPPETTEAAEPALPAPLVPQVDPVQKYNEEMAKLRARIQSLQDQEVELQLQVNSLTNQFFAPKTNETSRRQAQDRIGQTQAQLTAVRTELDQARKELQLKETAGPPKPQQ